MSSTPEGQKDMAQNPDRHFGAPNHEHVNKMIPKDHSCRGRLLSIILLSTEAPLQRSAATAICLGYRKVLADADDSAESVAERSLQARRHGGLQYQSALGTLA